MAFFYPAALAAGAWSIGAYALDLKRQALSPPVDEEGTPQGPPHFGAIGHISKWIHSDRRRFVSVEESVDELGATIFLVDYGTGAKTIQYVDPRILE